MRGMGEVVFKHAKKEARNQSKMGHASYSQIGPIGGRQWPFDGPNGLGQGEKLTPSLLKDQV